MALRITHEYVRLDIDDMFDKELLALQEQFANVNTWLIKDVFTCSMKFLYTSDVAVLFRLLNKLKLNVVVFQEEYEERDEPKASARERRDVCLLDKWEGFYAFLDSLAIEKKELQFHHMYYIHMFTDFWKHVHRIYYLERYAHYNC